MEKTGIIAILIREASSLSLFDIAGMIFATALWTVKRYWRK